MDNFLRELVAALIAIDVVRNLLDPDFGVPESLAKKRLRTVAFRFKNRNWNSVYTVAVELFGDSKQLFNRRFAPISNVPPFWRWTAHPRVTVMRHFHLGVAICQSRQFQQ